MGGVRRGGGGGGRGGKSNALLKYNVKIIVLGCSDFFSFCLLLLFLFVFNPPRTCLQAH